MLLRMLIGVALALLVGWAALVAFLMLKRPHGRTSKDALRLLPDTLRLLRRLSKDARLTRGTRLRVWLLFAYLAFPLDLVPDFLPVIGYADDVIITLATLRSVVRRAGPSAVRRHWPGNDEGLAALWRLAGLPGRPPLPLAD